MSYITDTFDVIVVGAGHAGVEAALAAARLGGKTLLATLSLDNVALMPCNPSIGGPAKGHLVRELDALGGQMGISADLACIQMRLLNTGKGYAVHALRGQEDKPFYHTLMKKIVEDQENLELKQLMIDKLLVENGAVVGVEAETGEIFEAKCVILATGTYLRGRIVYGQVNYECGPNGLRSAQKLSASLLENGVELMRFKTGTPARIDARSLDYSKMEPQYGDEEVRNFSFISDIKTREQVPCYLTYTNEATHKIIRDNLHLSGMYNGMIEGVGPRYCPSIESKIVRFANKERHQLFIEPEGRSTNEMYVQGMSSSLPAHIQLQFMQTIPGLEHCKMMRAGYAIDYDCLDPLQLRPSLEHKAISGLFSAGQSNGTSGYEEAAAQGLMAGINAMMKINGREPLVLRGRIVYGQVNYECGPNGLRSAQKLSASLLENGVELMRFKTGTPARIDARSLDYSKMEPQYGDEEVRNFSFISDIKTREQVPCYLTYTNEATHKIIRDNLHLSGMYNGMIEGVGPRYCPSIESKIVRFANKERHQLFIEPEGRSTNEMYVQGMSSSLPAHIQLQFMQTIPGLEHCKMMRAGYAIDYDCLDPLQLRPSLEHKAISGLFSAGQSNGTSGYEEAAAQGLMAGINAMMKINGREPLVLRRDEAYIGVLIDDLVTKGTSEPYRMMTSRAEYRLLLRQDNADLRLTEKGRAIGLVDDKRYGIFTEKRSALERTVSELGKQNISPSAENNAKLEAMGTAPLRSGSSLLDLLRRKEVTYSKLQQAFDLPELASQVAEQAEIFAKYEGYITKQRQEVERFMKLENKRLPDDIDYRAIKELSSEAAEKLDKVRPANIGQASRISGVSPADISVLMIALELKRRKEQEE